VPPKTQILGGSTLSTGSKIAKFAGILLLCLGTFCAADTATVKHHHKVKKPQSQSPPLPSGPTGPIQQIPLDSIAAVPPRVSYQNGLLTIVAPNSTLGDILRAVRKQTGADIDVPDARERVATTIGPGPAQEVMAELLNGSRFNYILLGSPQDPKALTRVVLVARSSSVAANHPAAAQQPVDQAANADQSQSDMSNDTSDADTAQPADDNSADQSAADQPAADADQQQNQPGVKTPQEVLQEKQQRQLQLQQQNNPGLNPHAPQQPPQQQPQ
jgi:hypothetical protein